MSQRLGIFIVLAFLAAGQVSRPASASGFIGFKFAGQIQSSSPGPVFGATVSDGASFFGHVIYDSASSPTHTFPGCGDCAGYAQRRTHGFFFQTDGLAIRLDDYLVSVFNDSPGVIPPLQDDILSMGLPLGAQPELDRRIFANGQLFESGFVDLSLRGPDTAFANSELPMDPMPGDFPFGAFVLSDGGDGSVDLFGSLDFVGGLQRFVVVEGDYDLDEVVAVSDYAQWKSAFGSTTDLAADGNNDGIVGAADYTVWRDALSEPLGSATLLTPEPSTLFIVVAGCFLTLPVRFCRS